MARTGDSDELDKDPIGPEDDGEDDPKDDE